MTVLSTEQENLMIQRAVEEEERQFYLRLETARDMFHDPRYRKLVERKRLPEPFRSRFRDLLGRVPVTMTHGRLTVPFDLPDFTSSKIGGHLMDMVCGSYLRAAKEQNAPNEG